MQSARNQLVTLMDHGLIQARNIDAALRETEVRPSNQSWRRFIERALTWFGILALSIALVFFIAYNWNELGRYAKFALVQIIMIAAILVYVKWPDKSVLSPALLVGTTIALGALLAFYGQTYQTGADPWNLFFGWAILMLPWALIGSTPILWLIFLTLLNLAFALFYSTFGVMPLIESTNENHFIWGLITLNGLALAIWEWITFRQTGASRYGPRLLALAVLAALAFSAVVDVLRPNYGGLVVYFVLMAAGFFIYRYRIRDLFVLAVGCLNAIVVGTTLFGRVLLEIAQDIGGLLLIALAVMASGAGAAIWLRNVHQEFNRE